MAKNVLLGHFIRKSELPQSCPIYNAVSRNEYLTDEAKEAMGDSWHLLPIKAIWNIPETIPTQNIYSDKTHSVGRKEFLKVVGTKD